MFRNVAFIFVTSLALPILLAWDLITTKGGKAIILPQDCKLQVNQELSLSLDGFFPSRAAVTWDVDYGTVASVLPGREATFIAPSRPAVVTISATISTGVPGMENRIKRQCTITSPPNAPGGLSLR